MKHTRKPGLLGAVGPGLLLAATGVGAGDLATAAFTGSELGTAVLWAVLLGASMKFVLNEGLARWQLATGTTLLEGAVGKFGRIVSWAFLPYLVVWSFFVSSALMSACGVTAHALIPLFEDASRAKIVFGIAHSLVGLALVLLGGFPLFERVMSVCIGVMFTVVIVTAVLLWPGTDAVVHGLLFPSKETLGGQGLTWTVALMGGIGGTLTVLCYGYWIREKNRDKPGDLTLCRVDLGAAYAMTAVFGVAMVIIGSQVSVEGRGAELIVKLSRHLERPLGATGRWLFLLGAWGAVFSSLLGVWQAVPYLFADFCGLVRRTREEESQATRPRSVSTTSAPYRAYLCYIALVPMAGLFLSFREVQKYYAVVGACFIPLLGLTLLVLNGRTDWVGRFRNGYVTRISLAGTLLFFSWVLWSKLQSLW